MTKTYIIPVVVKISWDEQYIDNQAMFLSSVVRDKVRKVLNNDPSILKWSIDKPNEVDISPLC